MSETNPLERQDHRRVPRQRGQVRRFEGANVLLLHTRGAKTGKERVNPLAYQPVGDQVAIFASKGGADTNPDWFHNLKANPVVTAEIGPDTVEKRARVAEGEERDRNWDDGRRP